MDASAFYRGTNSEQDGRFSNKDQEQLKKMKFPPSFNEKVDFKKVNFEVIEKWIREQVSAILGIDDEVTETYVCELLKEKEVSPKRMQVSLTPMLSKDTPTFMEHLWGLLLDAQKTPDGIPSELAEKKEESRKRSGFADKPARSVATTAAAAATSSSSDRKEEKKKDDDDDDSDDDRRHSYHRSSRHHHHHHHRSRSRSESRSRSPSRHRHHHRHHESRHRDHHHKSSRHYRSRSRSDSRSDKDDRRKGNYQKRRGSSRSHSEDDD